MKNKPTFIDWVRFGLTDDMTEGFIKRLTENQEDQTPEFNDIVNEYFDTLLLFDKPLFIEEGDSIVHDPEKGWILSDSVKDKLKNL